ERLLEEYGVVRGHGDEVDRSGHRDGRDELHRHPELVDVRRVHVPYDLRLLDVEDDERVARPVRGDGHHQLARPPSPPAPRAEPLALGADDADLREPEVDDGDGVPGADGDRGRLGDLLALRGTAGTPQLGELDDGRVRRDLGDRQRDVRPVRSAQPRGRALAAGHDEENDQEQRASWHTQSNPLCRSDQTASSFPLGSLKWNLRPPGNSNGSCVISPPALRTASRLASRSREYRMTSGPPPAAAPEPSRSPPASPPPLFRIPA